MSFPKIRRMKKVTNVRDWALTFCYADLRKERLSRAVWARALAKELDDAQYIDDRLFSRYKRIVKELLAEAEKDAKEGK